MLWRWSTRLSTMPMPVILVLRKLRQEDCHDFEASLAWDSVSWKKKIRSKRFIMWKIICKTDFYFLIKFPVQLKQETIYYSKYFNGKGSVNTSLLVLPNESQNYFSLNQIIEHTSFFPLVVLFFNMLIHVYDINSNKCLTFMVRITKV